MIPSIDDARPIAVVVASTYPRWEGDGEPGFVHELARRLTSEFRVVVVTPSSPGALAHELMDGVEVWRYRYAPRALETLVYGGGLLQHVRSAPWKALLLVPFLVGQLVAVLSVLRRLRPALLHAHWAIPQGVVVCASRALARTTTPVLLTSHGGDVLGLRGSFFARLRRWLGNRVARWTVVGAALAERLVEEGVAQEAGAFPVLPMGVDLVHRFCLGPEPRNPNEIAYVGRLVPGKGLDVLLAAMPRVIELQPHAHLLIVGEGPLAQALRDQAATLGIAESVSFVGMLPNEELPAVFRKASVHVAPFTAAQGFGLTLVESLGCGCPVITTQFSAVREIAARTPLIRLVAAGDVVALADALVAQLRDPPIQRQVEETIRKLRSRYDWGVIATAFRDLYAGLAAEYRA